MLKKEEKKKEKKIKIISYRKSISFIVERVRPNCHYREPCGNFPHNCQPSRFDREPPGAGVPLPVGKILPVTSRYSPDPVQNISNHIFMSLLRSATHSGCV